MKINAITTFFLVCLLTNGKWNLVVPVKATGDVDGSSGGVVASDPNSSGVASGSSAEGASGSADDTSSALASTESDSSGVVAGSEDSTENANESLDAGLSAGADADQVAEGTVSSDAAEAKVSSEVGASVSESSESKTHASLHSTLAAKLKPLKTGSDGNPVVMDRSEYLEDFFSHNLTYAFKQDVACTLVRFGDKDVWKSGDHGVNEPKSVTIDGVTGELTVRDKEKAVHFRMDDNKVWKHVVTMSRERKPKVLKEADPTDANQAKSESAEASADPNQASSVPANEAEAGSTDANQAESGSTDTSEQSKDASADADASGGSGTAADADSSGGDGSTVTKEQDPSSASAE